jgi:asparagine synthetase B (glutamine-hydrolysing)
LLAPQEELPPGLYSLQVEHGAVLAHSWEDPELLALAAYSRQNSSVDSLPAPTPRTHADELLHALDSAVARRVARGGAVAAAPGAASVLILFSGGLDSSLLAALAHRHVPAAEPIDLATVCFSGGTSRDRLAALDALQELQNLAPQRTWRLLEVDGSLAMMAEHRQRMLQLLHPCSTVMDRNIGFALWLAARSTGVCGGSPCTSAARIALLGTGADEQAAGYSRHRATFQHGGECALVAELEADVRRLWHRNLGRDDRLLSDCGREARFPFLDESVMACLARIPLAEVTNMAQPAGVGDKRVLRDIARGIGLHNAAARVKRAIQFGSGLGKAANVQDFGSGRAANARGGGTCSAY